MSLLSDDVLKFLESCLTDDTNPNVRILALNIIRYTHCFVSVYLGRHICGARNFGVLNEIPMFSSLILIFLTSLSYVHITKNPQISYRTNMSHQDYIPHKYICLLRQHTSSEEFKKYLLY